MTTKPATADGPVIRNLSREIGRPGSSVLQLACRFASREAHFTVVVSAGAIDCGDEVFAPPPPHLLGRACRLGRRRERLSDATLKSYEWRLHARLDQLLALEPSHQAGVKLQSMMRRTRASLFVFMTRRELPPTNNGSERALCPCAVFRKITNGFRTQWGAKLYVDIRSTLETARRRANGALEAVRLTLAGKRLELAGA